MKQDIRSLLLQQILDLPSAEKEEYGLLYTPREIYQQPDTWKETFLTVATQQQKLQAFLEECLDGTERERNEVWLVGAGTSDFIARSLVRLFRKKWQCQVQAIPSTDLQIEMDDLMTASKADRNLWISFSRSGESYESVHVIERALEKYPHVKHSIITCNKDGRMAKEIAVNNPNVYCLLLDDKVNDRGVAMTSSFTNLLVAGQCLANIDALENYEAIVNNMSSVGFEILPVMAQLAAKLASDEFARICFLGNGALKGIADECALKVLEFTDGHISTMAETFLSVRHGPLSWFDRDTLVVAFLSGSPEKSQFEVGLLKQLTEKLLARTTVAVTPQPHQLVSAYADNVIVLDLPGLIADDYFSVLDVLFGQCLGFYASLRNGLKPDTPSIDGPVQRVISEISVA